MDASNLDFPDQWFDAIFNFGIINHIPNWKECIAELKRVLKDGGSLILEDLSLDSFSGFPGVLLKLLLAHPYEQMYTAEEFVGHLENVGFTIDHFKKSNPLIMLKHFFWRQTYSGQPPKIKKVESSPKELMIFKGFFALALRCSDPTPSGRVPGFKGSRVQGFEWKKDTVWYLRSEWSLWIKKICNSLALWKKSRQAVGMSF